MSSLSSLLNRIYTALTTLRNEKGQGLVEYALILVLIAVVVVAAVTAVGSQANSVFSTVTSSIP